MTQDLRQADLSALTLKQMNAAQRAELRRRFDAFKFAFGAGPRPAAPEAPKAVRKWQPGMKAQR